MSYVNRIFSWDLDKLREFFKTHVKGAISSAIKTDGSAYDISEHFPTSGPNSDGKFTLEYILSNADTLIPTVWRKGGMSIRFVSSSDNKYIQARLMANAFTTDVTQWQSVDDAPTAGSNNLVKSGGVLTWSEDNYGKYVENPEFVEVKTDADNRILWAIKADGTIYYGAGTPPQVIKYINDNIKELHLESVNDIILFLGDLFEDDKTLQQLLDEKLNAEGLDSDALATQKIVENPEFMDIKAGKYGNIFSSRNNDGLLKEYKGIDLNKTKMIPVFDNEGRIEKSLGNNQKVISYRDKDGTLHENAGIDTPNVKTEHINVSGKILNKRLYNLLFDSNVTQINDGLADTSACDAEIDFDEKYGVAACFFAGGYGFYGEQHKYGKLSIFSLHQPERFEVFDVDNWIIPSNILSLGDGIFRLIYIKDYVMYYRDFDITTKTFGEQIAIQMYSYGESLQNLTPQNRDAYITDSGLTIPSESDPTQIWVTSKLKKYGNKVYGTILGYNNYGIIFYSDDNMQTVHFIKIIQEVIQYEADLIIDEDIIGLVYRQRIGIFYTYATFSNDVIGNFGKGFLIPYSIDSRPRLFAYNGKNVVLFTINSTEEQTFPRNRGMRMGVKMLSLNSLSNIEDNTTLFEYTSKYGMVYPDVLVNNDDLYMIFSDSRAALETKNTEAELEQGKECMEFIKITNFLN